MDNDMRHHVRSRAPAPALAPHSHRQPGRPRQSSVSDERASGVRAPHASCAPVLLACALALQSPSGVARQMRVRGSTPRHASQDAPPLTGMEERRRWELRRAAPAEAAEAAVLSSLRRSVEQEEPSPAVAAGRHDRLSTRALASGRSPPHPSPNFAHNVVTVVSCNHQGRCL